MDSQKTIFFYLISLQNVDYYLITNKGQEAAGVNDIERALGIKQSATEETLQSIDSTLKRIEAILLDHMKSQFCALDVQDPLEQM